MQYRGPQVIATTLEKYLFDRKDGMILDVAAGTGLVAEKVIFILLYKKIYIRHTSIIK